MRVARIVLLLICIVCIACFYWLQCCLYAFHAVLLALLAGIIAGGFVVLLDLLLLRMSSY